MTKKEYLKKLVSFAAQSDFVRQLPLEELGYSDDPVVNEFIFDNDLAFVYGLLFDQGMRSVDAWKSPFLLKKRLGSLDVLHISRMDTENLTSILSQKKALHRYPKVMSRNLINASKTIVSDFSGNISRLWEDHRTIEDVRKNFLMLCGIGPKKADLALLMLVRDRGVALEGCEQIGVAFDVHVSRVFLRSGFYTVLDKEEKNTLQNDISTLHALPALLGTAVWDIGRHYCHKSSPACDRCPLAEKCQKRIER